MENPTSHSGQKVLHWLGVSLAWFALGCLTVWAAAALYFDLSFSRLPALAPILYLSFVVTLSYLAKSRRARMAICGAGFLIVLVCWLSIRPSNNRRWKPDNSQTPWAEIDGDRVTIHNFRHCFYRSEHDFTCEWLEKTVFLSQIRGIDLFVDYWGSSWIAHPIVSFQFGDEVSDYVATSIEARYQVGQDYSPIRSLFRQFTIIYVFASERDLVRLRTNYRSGEKVYLYHMVAGPEWSRRLFLEYLQQANSLRDRPRWFNALTSNCTTNIFDEMAATGHLPAGSSRYSWWVILNGRAPQMLYKGGNFAGNLPFRELQQQALINPVAITLDDAPEFSQRIRQNRAGFDLPASGPGPSH